MNDIHRRFRDDPRFTMKLVKQIRNNPCIYNYRLPEYSVKSVTEEAWLRVAKSVNETVTHCKTKWKNLRAVFVRGLRPNPGDSTKIRRPYYLNNSMRFLLPYLKKSPHLNSTVRASLNSPPQTEFVEHEEDTEEDYTDIEELEELEDVQTENPLYNLDNFKQEKMDNEDDVRNEIIIVKPPETTIRTQKSKISEDENLIIEPQRNEDLRKMFLLSLLPEVRELTEKQMRKFKRKVLELIDDVSAE